MVVQFYVINKSRLQYKFVEIRNYSKVHNIKFRAFLTNTDWTFCDSMSIENSKSAFWKLEFNKMVKNGLVHDIEYNNVKLSDFPLFEYYEYIGTTIIEF